MCHPKRGGGLRGGGTVETLAGEEGGGGFDELTAAFAGGEEGFVLDGVKWFHFVWVGRKNGFFW